MATAPPMLPGETEDEYLIRLNAEASRRQGGQHLARPRSEVTSIAGLMARIEAGLPPPPAASGHLERPPRRNRSKLQQADILDGLPGPDSAKYHAALADALRYREKGHALTANIAAVGRAIYFGMATNRRLTMAQIAKRAGCCVETARKCIIFLEARGLFGVMNVLVRIGRDLVRGANLYLSVALIDPAAAGTRRVSRRFASSLAEFLQKAADLTGLVARPMGLNTTPLRQPGGT